MRCMSCRKGGSYWCEQCDRDYHATMREVRGIVGYMGQGYGEGRVVLTAHELMESERLLGLTSVGKAAILGRARELLAEVEDHFTHTPTCVLCGTHKMELIPGDPMGVTCTKGCDYGG